MMCEAIPTGEPRLPLPLGSGGAGRGKGIPGVPPAAPRRPSTPGSIYAANISRLA